MRRALLVGTCGLAILVFPARSQETKRAQRTTSAQAQGGANVEPQQGPSSTANAPTNAVPQPPSSAPAEEALGITVVLDPAHGGADFGARGPTGLAESDVVLDFARAARIALEAERLRVLLTREGNQNPSFDNRSELVNGLHNAIFISLHVSSTGPVGTARSYFYVFPSDATQTFSSGVTSPNPGTTAASPGSAVSTPAPAAQTARPLATAQTTLIEWDHAQRSSVESSRQLATLVQNELVQRLKGSPGMPIAAPVRQLRTIAAPAIAIELSSINVSDSKRLEQMAQPLAESISKAVAEFHYPVNPPAAGATGVH